MPPDHVPPLAPAPAGERGRGRGTRPAALALALVAALPGVPRLARAEPPGDRVEIGTIDLEALLDLEVEAVSRHGERGSEAPAWVFVLTGDDLRRQGARTLHDGLRTVPGLFAYADGLYPMIGVRGVGLLSDYTTRLLVLVDGHPLNNSVGIGQSYLGRDLPVPLSAIERVEVIEGPVGSVYGPTAFLGVVNVVTRAPGTRASGAATGAEGAKDGAAAADAEAWGGLEGGGVRAFVAGAAAGGPGASWTYPELALDPSRASPAGGRVDGADAGRTLSAYGRATWRELELSTACGGARGGVPSSPYSAIVGDDRNYLENRTCFAQLGWRGAASPTVDVAARVAVDAFRYRDAFAYAPPPDDVGMFRDDAYDRWVTAEVRSEWRPSGRARVAAGVAAEAHETSQRAFAEDPSVGAGPIDRDFRTVNAFVLAERAVGSRLWLHGGLTLFAHEMFGARVTPKLAALFRPGPSDVVKAVWSEGFRAPTMSEAFYEDGTDFLANPDLRPETAYSAEVVYERRIRAVASVIASAAYSTFHDLIRFETVPAPGLPGPPDPSNPADFRQQGRNVDALRTVAAQLGVTLRLPAVVAWGGVSVQRPLAGADPANFPRLTGSVAATARWPWRPLALSASAQVLSSRRKDVTALAPGARTEVPAAVVGAATAVLDVPGARGLSVEVGVRGLGGERVLHPVTGDFTPISELPDSVPTLRLGVRWTR